MPSEIMNPQGLSSPSFLYGDACFPNKGQVGFQKSDPVPDHCAGSKSIDSSPLEKLVPMEYQTIESQEHPEFFSMRNRKMNHSLDGHAVQAERAGSQSVTLLGPVYHDVGPRSSLLVKPASFSDEGDKFNMMTAQYENSLFSSSLSDIFSRKLRLPSNNALYGHSVDTVASHYEEEEPLESLEEIEAQTIGNLLPSDDDLFSGVADGLDYVVQASGGDDVEELDFFSSVGGMELGDDGSSAVPTDSEFPGGISNGHLGPSNGSVAGEHPYGEHPSRTLFVRNINSNVEDSELKALFEQYGDIRTLYTACKHRGFVMISYFDIRAARNAMKALQNKPLRRRKLDIHYSIPKDYPSEKDINQGTLVVFNLDSSVSTDELRQIFAVYGEIKEIRETPQRSYHKFVEFYDVRAAEAALHALNRSDIAGKQIKLEPSRPGGSRRLVQQFPSELLPEDFSRYLPQNSPPNDSTTGFSEALPYGAVMPSSMENGTILAASSAIRAPFMETTFHHGISSSVPNRLPSLVGVESVGNQTGLAESVHSLGQLKFDIRGSTTSSVFCDSLGTMATNINTKPPERIDSRKLCRVNSNGQSVDFNEGVFGSAGTVSCSLPGHHYAWSNPYHPQTQGLMWRNSQFVNRICAPQPSPPLPGLPRAPTHMSNTVLPLNNHHVGSAPTLNPSLWDRQHTYAGESSEASGFHPGSLGSMRISSNSLHSMEFASHNIFSHIGGNCMDLPIAPKIELQSPHQRSTMLPGGGQMFPMMNSFDSPNEHARNRRNEGSINQVDKKQFELDIDRILRGEDNRTTLMIKNIPNKYTSKMLLAAIDEHHRGTYDFIYLPIDFKNKCNVGYAFINMTDPNQIIPFYKAFNGKKWEKFNSEKVASLAYARIQGKAALIAHFQNSSLMNEDKRCRPILFNTDGPNAGDQMPFPMGVNVRTRPGKARNVTHEENLQVSPINLANGDDFSRGDTSSGSVKESN